MQTSPQNKGSSNRPRKRNRKLNIIFILQQIHVEDLSQAELKPLQVYNTVSELSLNFQRFWELMTSLVCKINNLFYLFKWNSTLYWIFSVNSFSIKKQSKGTLRYRLNSILYTVSYGPYGTSLNIIFSFSRQRLLRRFLKIGPKNTPKLTMFLTSTTNFSWEETGFEIQNNWIFLYHQVQQSFFLPLEWISSALPKRKCVTW